MCNEILQSLFEKTKSDETTVVIKCDDYYCEFGNISKKEDIYRLVTEKLASDLDNESSYKKEFNENNLKPSNWASARGLGKTGIFFRFCEEKITMHLENVFKKIEYAILNKFQMENILARNNLFHAHMVYNCELKDLLIIFHAFEYPSDRESYKSRQARKVEPAVPEFTSGSPRVPFKWRNSIYSRSKNCIYVLDASAEHYKCLLAKDLFMALDERKCGLYLCDLNYFHKENVHLFLA